MTVSEALQELAGDYRWRASRAAELLTASGGAAVPGLCELLRTGSVRARWRAATVLGQIGDPAAVPALEEALDDRHALVRERSAEALLALGATGVLARAAETGSVEVRRRAVLTLRRLSEPVAIRALARAIEDRDVVVRCQAAAGLAELARTAPTLALRLALPPLTARAEYWLTGRAERREMAKAARAIERATQSLHDLPVPAAADRSGDALPIPAVPPRDCSDLPRVSDGG
ncbi:MAG: HEAT repeat domain-containing protein [Armatimonadota bacterium]